MGQARCLLVPDRLRMLENAVFSSEPRKAS